MKPDRTLLIELSQNTTGANVHQAKNLEYAYKGFCKLSVHGKTAQTRKEARTQARMIAQEIRDLISESPSPA